jgi:hypothetical protein
MVYLQIVKIIITYFLTYHLHQGTIAKPRDRLYMSKRHKKTLWLWFQFFWMTMIWARDRGGVLDLSVNGNKSDFGGRWPSRSDYDEQARSANAIAELTPCGYRPCWSKISLITKINSCPQSMNKQEFEASNLNITRRWSLQYTKTALCGYSLRRRLLSIKGGTS